VPLGDALLELQDLTRRLRRDCPWDREQTALTIVPHTIEEAYEVADAAQAGDRESWSTSWAIYSSRFISWPCSWRSKAVEIWRRWRGTFMPSSSAATRTCSGVPRPARQSVSASAGRH
jgi:hypothetical protein